MAEADAGASICGPLRSIALPTEGQGGLVLFSNPTSQQPPPCPLQLKQDVVPSWPGWWSLNATVPYSTILKRRQAKGAADGDNTAASTSMSLTRSVLGAGSKQSLVPPPPTKYGGCPAEWLDVDFNRGLRLSQPPVPSATPASETSAQYPKPPPRKPSLRRRIRRRPPSTKNCPSQRSGSGDTVRKDVSPRSGASPERIFYKHVAVQADIRKKHLQQHNAEVNSRLEVEAFLGVEAVTREAIEHSHEPLVDEALMRLAALNSFAALQSSLKDFAVGAREAEARRALETIEASTRTGLITMHMARVEAMWSDGMTAALKREIEAVRSVHKGLVDLVTTC